MVLQFTRPRCRLTINQVQIDFLIFSFTKGANNPQNADPELFVPIISNPVLPQKIRKFFRFGVPLRCKIDVDSEEKMDTSFSSHSSLEYETKNVDDIEISKL